MNSLRSEPSRRQGGAAPLSMTVDPLQDSSTETWSVNVQSRAITDAPATAPPSMAAGMWRYPLPALLLIVLAALGHWRVGKRAEREAGLMAAVPSSTLTPAVVRAQPSEATENVTLPGNVQA